MEKGLSKGSRCCFILILQHFSTFCFTELGNDKKTNKALPECLGQNSTRCFQEGHQRVIELCLLLESQSSRSEIMYL